jgi:cephalosporin hydroxylase
MRGDGALPPAVSIDLTVATMLEYWRARADQHIHDAYVGVPLSKFPEDLRVYEHLLWLQTPDTVIEVGTQWGGSALWFRGRLRTLRDYGRIGSSWRTRRTSTRPRAGRLTRSPR